MNFQISKVLQIAYIIHTLILISFFAEIANFVSYEQAALQATMETSDLVQWPEVSLLRKIDSRDRNTVNLETTELEEYMYKMQLEIFQLIGVLIV